MQTTVYLIRHGEVEYQYDEKGRRLIYGPSTSLSQEGRDQMEKLARKLKTEGISIDCLFTSPYRRAVQSAKIAAEILSVNKIEVEENLKDVNEQDGAVAMVKTMEELAMIGGGEYKPEVAKRLTERIYGAINSLILREKGKTFAIVGHGDPTRAYVGWLMGERPMPHIVRDELYYGKGEAWRLVFDDSLNLKERILITGENLSSSSPERKIF